MPDRYRKLARELLSFSFAGAVNTAFGFLLFNLLFGLGSLTANAISTAGGTATSFVLNRHITYRHRPRRLLRHELPLFIAVNLVGLGIQQAVMAIAKVMFDLQADDRLEFNLARVVSVIFGTVFLLLSYRYLVFRKAKVQFTPDIAPISPPVALAALTTDSDEFDELTVPLEVELSHDLDAPELALDGFVPADPSTDGAVRSAP